MSGPHSQYRQRVHELRFMAVQARYDALRMSNANMRGYADELEHEAARLEDLLGSEARAVSREKTKPGSL
jgi:hypothetical protein